jgi:hypothetical protein
MEIGTVRSRWPQLIASNRYTEEREDRSRRTNVTRLDYHSSGGVVAVTCRTPLELTSVLNGDSESEFRLFVVEDLSRDVIEALGSHLEIEPDFFLEHIYDDSLAVPPNLSVDTRQQQRLQLRFMMAQHFETPVHFMKGIKEVESFNILRSLEDGQSSSNKGARVGIIRTKASFWLRNSGKSENKGAVGMYSSV